MKSVVVKGKTFFNTIFVFSLGGYFGACLQESFKTFKTVKCDLAVLPNLLAKYDLTVLPNLLAKYDLTVLPNLLAKCDLTSSSLANFVGSNIKITWFYHATILFIGTCTKKFVF